jgi:hypothetical protein
MWTWHPRLITHQLSSRPEHVLGTLAAELATVQRFNNPYVHPDEPVGTRRRHGTALIVLGSDHRSNVHAAGWDKHKAQEFVWQHVGNHAAGV